MSRHDKIVKTSIIGIAVNLILVAFKATIGILTNSIAIMMDAVNNSTDALSSIITIIGTRLAEKAPDKDHPYGYGRVEYFSSMIIVAIVLWAGFAAFMESWPKILNPDATHYTAASLVIIAVAVVVKFVLGRYVKGVGEEVNSEALVASGSDAFFDGILSFSTLIAAAISMLFHISLEGILGVLISIVIIKAGTDMLKETIKSMIGAKVNSKLSTDIKKSIFEVDGIHDVYNLVLHDYGPENIQGSVYIEVDSSLTPLEIQKLSHDLIIKIRKEFNIKLTFGISIRYEGYPQIRSDLEEITSKYVEILETHAFIVYEKEKLVTFLIIVDFNADNESVKEKIIAEIKSKHPQFNYYITDAYDVSR